MGSCVKVRHGEKGEQTHMITLKNKNNFLSDVQLKVEENPYLHYFTEIYITQKVTVDDFLCGTYLLNVKQ
jgi:hypothetical protein